ncbi:DUF2867 domain-containing protein, partial [Lysobacter maris]
LTAPAASLAGRACRRSRSLAGRIGARWSALRRPIGFAARNPERHRVLAYPSPPADTLLAGVLDGAGVHQDWFELRLPAGAMADADTTRIMSLLLQGFVDNQAASVTGLMAFRNLLVKPLGLRTSRLGCPVSSLLSGAPEQRRFDGRFPVLDMRRDAGGHRIEVLLGADDRHLSFRSSVSVERGEDTTIRCRLGTRVRPRNLFGRFYMAMIAYVHRRHVSPTMLRSAVEHALLAADAGSLAADPGDRIERCATG